jgi:hypothetical protein
MDCWQNCSIKGGLIMDKLGTTQVANVGSKKKNQDHFISLIITFSRICLITAVILFVLNLLAISKLKDDGRNIITHWTKGLTGRAVVMYCYRGTVE